MSTVAGALILIGSGGLLGGLLVHLGLFRPGGPPGWSEAPRWLRAIHRWSPTAGVAVTCALAGALCLAVLEGTSLVRTGRVLSPMGLVSWAVAGSTITAFALFVSRTRR